MDLKMAVSKLEDGENWVKWKRQMTLFLRHHNVMRVVSGSKTSAEALANGATAAQIAEYEKKLSDYEKDNSFAQLIILGTLSDTQVEIVGACNTANCKKIWDKLLSVHEQTSGQRADRLMEQFFKAEIIHDEDIASYIGRFELIFRQLNEKIKKLNHNELPELLLTSRIMSTLPPDYFEFKSVWESIPTEARTVNNLIERLRLIELRLPNKRDNTEAFLAKSASKKKIEAKFESNKDKKKIMKCYICNKTRHFKQNCPQKDSHFSKSPKDSHMTMYLFLQ